METYSCIRNDHEYSKQLALLMTYRVLVIPLPMDSARHMVVCSLSMVNIGSGTRCPATFLKHFSLSQLLHTEAYGYFFRSALILVRVGVACMVGGT